MNEFQKWHYGCDKKYLVTHAFSESSCKGEFFEERICDKLWKDIKGDICANCKNFYIDKEEDLIDFSISEDCDTGAYKIVIHLSKIGILEILGRIIFGGSEPTDD